MTWDWCWNALVGFDAVVLYQDSQPGLTKTRFLQIGDVLVRIELTAGVAAAQGLARLHSAATV